MDRHEIDWERIERWVSGQASPDELASLEAWVRADPELSAIAAALRAIGRSSGGAGHRWDVESAWQRLRRHMNRAPLRLLSSAQAIRGRLGYPLGSRARFPARSIFAAAAALILVAAAALFRWRGTAPALQEVATRRSQTAVIALPDGSRIMLGPASRLRFPPGIGALRAGRAGDVYLEGEAYLDLKHETTRPVRVHTASGVVEDIGTRFLVAAYPETHGMRVAVASGSVAVLEWPTPTADRAPASSAAPRPLLTLASGDVADVRAGGIATLTHDVNLAPYVAWTEGNLAFDGTRLADAIPELERWYDVELRLADGTLADRRLTATFRRESLSQVLELLALSLDLRVERQGRSVLLAPTRRGRPSP